MADKQRLFQPVRNSRMLLEEVYFRTATVKDWRHLLKNDKYKQLVLDVWHDLVAKELLVMYGFVLMPKPCLQIRQSALMKA